MMALSIACPSIMLAIGCKYRITSDITALIGDALTVRGPATLCAGIVVRVTTFLDDDKIAQVEAKGASYLVGVQALCDRSVEHCPTGCTGTISQG